MNTRIEKLTELTLDGKMFPAGRDIELNRFDLFLPDTKKDVRRMHDYIMAQDILLNEYQTMARPATFSSLQVVGDYMHHNTMEHINDILKAFYKKPIDNLSTFEWQHATADYSEIIRLGVTGLKERIRVSLDAHKEDPEAVDFLECLDVAADTLSEWAQKCSSAALALSDKTDVPEYKANLIKLSQTLKRIPAEPAQSFYEAVLSIYILFSYDPDSLGTLDRTLRTYYQEDIKNGLITRDEAKTILQELFLMLQANTPKTSGNFTRGGESHFCVGGYDENGEDTFDDFSMLIVESVLELPTYIPEISLRWTKKLPFETFFKIFEMSVNDKNARIAFVNDDSKIRALTNIAHFPYEVACRYSSVGCNEVAFPGGYVGGTTNTNILRSIENTMFNRCDDIINAASWNEFYEIYKSELYADVDLMLKYEDEFNRVRGKDVSYATSLLFLDCIDRAKSFTRGACRYATAGPGLIGITNVIDSLAVIKQFVYDEKTIDMRTLTNALKNDWVGYEDLLNSVKKRGAFFGNDDSISREVSALLCDTLYEYTKEKRSAFGYPIIFGNLQGYCPHHRIFGEATKATPDGRKNGEMLKFGLSQSGANDREGLSALLNSIAACDKSGIISGTASVSNFTLDSKLTKGAENLKKTALLFDTYFQNGGTQFQLNFVSAEDLKKAKLAPDEYRNLRVRVSGFSDFFVNLDSSVQDSVIERTVKENA